MPTMTYSPVEYDAYKAQLGILQENGDFGALIDVAFCVDEDRKKQIKHRYTFKDSIITSTPSPPDTAKMEDLVILPLEEKINNVLDSKNILKYTDEYISIKRKEYISKLLNSLEEIESNLSDLSLYSMNYKLLLNEFSKIYRFFLKTHQEEIFLSIINLIEEIFINNKIDKKIIRTTLSILKSLKDLENIDYIQYDKAVRKFFNSGIDFVSIKDMISVE